MTDKEKCEILKRLKARLECDELQVKGIAEICNPPYMCLECNLCYAQGTLGQRNNDLAIAISSLQNSIPREWIEKFMNRFRLGMVTSDEYALLHFMLTEWEKENEKGN